MKKEMLKVLHLVFGVILLLGVGNKKNVCAEQLFEGGPFIAEFQRDKERGSHQSGALYGWEGRYERDLLWGLYLGAEGGSGWGELQGQTSRGRPLSSEYEERWMGARLGGRVFFESLPSWSLASYVFHGQFWNTNAFEPPTDTLVRLKNHFESWGAGASVTSVRSQGWNVALEGKIEWVFEGESRIVNDAILGNVCLQTGEGYSAALRFPLTYKGQASQRGWRFLLAPTFRWRHLSSRENTPYNYVGTDYATYGCVVGGSCSW